MAVEGEFPKSDGDILFASEVNQIRANTLLGPSSGITPTLAGSTGFDTAPTTLTNITDGDVTSVTGTGIALSPGGGVTDCSVNIDLGEDGVYSTVFYKVGLWLDSNGGGTSDALFYIKKDGGGFVNVGAIISDLTATSETIYEGSFPLNASTEWIVRYLNITLRGDNSDGNLNSKFYYIGIK